MEKESDAEYKVVAWGCSPSAKCWHKGCETPPTCYLSRFGLGSLDWDASCNDHVPNKTQDMIAEMLLKVAEELPMPGED